MARSFAAAAGSRWLGALFACAALALSVGTAFAGHLPATVARVEAPGRVALDIVYYAEDTCSSFADVREGAPKVDVDGPKSTLVVTVTLDTKSGPCEPKLTTLEHRIVMADRPGVLSVDIFYVAKDGHLHRLQRVRIYREDDLREDEVCRDTSAASPHPKC